MAWRPQANDLTPFLSPNRTRDAFFPSLHYDPRPQYHGYTSLSRNRSLLNAAAARQRRNVNEPASPQRQAVAVLLDKTLDHHGDMGWSLDYATAWCYRHLIGNQTEVADAIDRIRELDTVERKTPYIIFDYVDKALFNNRLKNMVFLQWKSLSSASPGTTSAPGVVTGIPRLCIELNKTLFEEDGGDIDDLLDALIHQMIHAFFLVCCGAQPKVATQDGRLLDGLHFGVILYTINDITRSCQDGALDLIFYATARRCQRGNGMDGSVHRYGRPEQSTTRQNISLDSRGTAIPPAPADGQTHCNHDNRKIDKTQIKNWQVEEYSRAIDMNFEARGDVVHDLGVDGAIKSVERLKGPPSSTYAELLWNGNRVMIPLEKTAGFPNLQCVLKKCGKNELKVAECSKDVFKCLYDFIQHGHYWKDIKEQFAEHGIGSEGGLKGPPMLIDCAEGFTSPHGIVTQLSLFKVAEDIKFEELMKYVLERLHDAPFIRDDPILILKELYCDGSDGFVNSELHTWARGFFKRTASPRYGMDGRRQDHYSLEGVYSNYEKIYSQFSEALENLAKSCPAMKADIKLALAELSVEMAQVQIDPLAYHKILPSIYTHVVPNRLARPRSRSRLDPFRYPEAIDYQGPSCSRPLPWQANSALLDHGYYDDDYPHCTERQRALNWTPDPELPPVLCRGVSAYQRLREPWL
ncbi:Hypothetical protein R9X50_00233500 [Acrodontium crateriforme]|uniref:SprT-like domain-containing protein n=1 Tax=Acrodontium crateriforme TaxID=150365 RepID=A0AAQ3R8H1_9PEZI|nr:Hypothetical protein R9X50_00233500 [Acrodontium crateriforme]